MLITHERFAPDFAGGGEVVVLHTAKELMRRGVDVRVLTTGDPQLVQHDGIPTVRLPISRYRFNLEARRIARMAREADLVHTFNYHACLASLVAARRVRRPIVCTILALFHDAWLDVHGPLAGRLWMAWEYFLVRRRFDRVTYLSDYSRRLGLAMGASARRSVVISPGIELEHYGPAPQKQDHVLFVGKYDARKGIHDVLAVAAEMPDIAFRAMGWGAKEQAYRDGAPGNVEFVTFERGRKLREAFARARIFICASRAETFGLAIVEAMASGCALVSTIDLGFEGILIPSGDRPAMAKAIRRLWSDRAMTEAMGARNVELAQTYSWSRYMSMLMPLYDELLNESRGSPE